MDQQKFDDMQKRLAAQERTIARMQRVINWVARSAYIHAGGGKAYFIGHVIDEVKALDNGDPLKG